MKVAFAVVLLFHLYVDAPAQHLYGAMTMESTAAGFRMGTAAGYMANNNVQVGFFYQQAINRKETFQDLARSFAGIETIIPVAGTEKIRFSIHTRFGVANKQFVVFVPGVRTTIRLTNAMALAAGMHWRFNRPAHELSIVFKI